MKKTLKLAPLNTLPDFPKIEKQLLNWWYQSGIVEQYLKKNRHHQKKFSFLDGPITANNPMGVHHGWGRTYKDLWQRFQNMSGSRQRFQNGFDCQGLWVEVEVEKELGFKSKKDIENYGIARFVNQCKHRVIKYAKIQTEQSKRLGYFMDWDNSYFTMSDENNYLIWYFLKKCWQNGWLYQGKDSVPWCPRCETAISQHEMLTEDYKEVTHKSIYFELPLLGRQREFLLVWTTTPWTIPANIAIAVDPQLDYSLVEGLSGDKFWLAHQTVDRLFGQDKKRVLKTVKGKDLVGLKYQAPFDDLPAVSKVAQENPGKFHLIVATDQQILPITTDEGTGLVHTAVSAGSEDFKLGQKLGLPMIRVINDNAAYLPDLGFLSGKNAKKHPEIILDYLVSEDKKPDKDWVFKIENYHHRYPACWRCKTELVWKVTDEWYLAMDKGKPSLRERMKKIARQINWIPSFGLDRELDWLDHMHDWLISKKNRFWGLALPIYQCSACGDFQVIGSKAELKQRAVSGWSKFNRHTPHRPWIDAVKINCRRCNQKVSRIKDVGNPWLDAGIVPFSTLLDPKTKQVSYLTDKKYFEDWFPADFITESFPGQFKNWFYSLIAMATVLENKAPFKTVFGFATVLGEDGRPMHKSWGNAIEFNEAAEKIGVDVMRWLYIRQNPFNNLLFGYQVADQIRRQFHLILYNSLKFFVSNAALDHWHPQPSKSNRLSLLDQWLLSRLYSTLKTVTQSLINYDAMTVAFSLESLVTDLSTWYIRRSRHRIGLTAADQVDKNSCYYCFNLTFSLLLAMLAPLLPFFSEYLYQNLPGPKAISLHLTKWPQNKPQLIKPALEKQMAFIRLVIEQGHAQRKKHHHRVRQPLQSITVKGINQKLHPQLIQLIKDELNLKNVILKPGKTVSVKLDTLLTGQLIKEGQAREIIRQIQQARKESKTKPNQVVDVILPSWPKEFESEIKYKALINQLKTGPKLVIISH